MEPRRVPVNWDDLEMALTDHGDEWSYYLDLRTGEVRIVRIDAFEEEEDLSDEDVDAGVATGDLLTVEPLPSSVEYAWMAEFAASLSDPRLRELLQVALNGRGAFRRFKDVLLDHGPERARWFAFRDERLRDAMREWLADHGLDPSTSPPERSP